MKIETNKYFVDLTEEKRAAMRAALRYDVRIYRDFNEKDSSANVILESIWNAAMGNH